MSRRLPSLKALRSFEAAARHSSFSKAAEELCVTQAAIGRQVHELESWFGARLFIRSGRGVVPTEAARTYQRTLSRLFDELEVATRKLARAPTSGLKVQVDPPFAGLWLVVRLGHFRSAHPDIEVSLKPSRKAFDPHATEAELAIAYVPIDDGRRPPGQELLKAHAFPVCSPRLLKGKTIDGAAELLRYPLLHDLSRSRWLEWLRAAGQSPGEDLKGPVFEDAQYALLAAEAGQGVALGDEVIAFDAIRSGRLVRILDVSFPAGSYRLLSPVGEGQSPAATKFRSWLRKEMRVMRQALKSAAIG